MRILMPFWYLDALDRLPEIKNLFSKIGFKVVKVYTAIPGYVFPEEIVDIDDKDEIKEKVNSVRKRKSRKIVWGIISKIGLTNFFTSNFIVLCQK